MKNKAFLLSLIFIATTINVEAQDTASEVTARVKQFEKEYSASANAVVLGAHFTSDAVMLDLDGKKLTGPDAAGQWHANAFEHFTAKLSIVVDDVIELPGGYAFAISHYTNVVTSKSDGAKSANSGWATTLYRKENGVWKIFRHTLVHEGKQ